MRICYKIHIFGFMSQHLCVSGSSARSMSLDSCLSIFVSHGCSANSTSTSPDSCLSIFISQDPLQDPCLRIHVSDSGLSIHMYLRNLCKIHVSGSVYKHPYIYIYIYISGSSARSMSPIHVSESLYLRVLCKIHVFGFMSQHPHVSQEPLQDPCLRIHVSDSGLSIHMYPRNLC